VNIQNPPLVWVYRWPRIFMMTQGKPAAVPCFPHTTRAFWRCEEGPGQIKEGGESGKDRSGAEHAPHLSTHPSPSDAATPRSEAPRVHRRSSLTDLHACTAMYRVEINARMTCLPHAEAGTNRRTSHAVRSLGPLRHFFSSQQGGLIVRSIIAVIARR